MKNWLAKKAIGTIPVWTILLTVVVAGVAAAFLLVTSFDTTISASDAPVGHRLLLHCNVIAGMGAVDDCTENGNNYTVAVSGVDDESIVQLDYAYQSLSGTAQVLSFIPPSPLPVGISSLICEIGSAGSGVLCDGQVIVTGEPHTGIWITAEMFDLVGGEVISDLDFQVTAHHQ